jgi:hypothetical protein
MHLIVRCAAPPFVFYFSLYKYFGALHTIFLATEWRNLYSIKINGCFLRCGAPKY